MQRQAEHVDHHGFAQAHGQRGGPEGQAGGQVERKVAHDQRVDHHHGQHGDPGGQLAHEIGGQGGEQRGQRAEHDVHHAIAAQHVAQQAAHEQAGDGLGHEDGQHGERLADAELHVAIGDGEEGHAQHGVQRGDERAANESAGGEFHLDNTPVSERILIAQNEGSGRCDRSPLWRKNTQTTACGWARVHRRAASLQADAKSVVLFNDGMVTNRLFVYGTQYISFWGRCVLEMG